MFARGESVALLHRHLPTLPEEDAVRTHDLLLHHAHHNLIGVLPSVLAAGCAIAAGSVDDCVLK